MTIKNWNRNKRPPAGTTRAIGQAVTAALERLRMAVALESARAGESAVLERVAELEAEADGLRMQLRGARAEHAALATACEEYLEAVGDDCPEHYMPAVFRRRVAEQRPDGADGKRT